jgi:hypothetical protein
MKFGDFLEDHLISEWRSQYLNYTKGKTKLKKLARFLETSTECQCDSGEVSALRRSPDIYNQNDVDRNDLHSVLGVKNLNKIDYQRHDLQYHNTEFDLSSDNDDNYENDDNENNENDFRIVSLVDKLNNENTPLLKSFENNISHHRSHSTSILYIKGQQPRLTQENDDIRKLAKQQFIDWVNIELIKVDNFYKYKERECMKRLVILLDQLNQLKNQEIAFKKSSKSLVSLVAQQQSQLNNNDNINCHHHSNKQKNRKCCKNLKIKKIFSIQSIQKRFYFIFDYFEMPSFPKYFWKNHSASNSDSFTDSTYQIDDSSPPFFISKVMIKKAICELYHKTELLNSFRIVNRTAFRKLIKKYDKRCHDSKLVSYMNKVDSMYFNSSENLTNITNILEDKFSEVFEDGHHKTAITKLRSFSVEKAHYKSNFISGYLIGISCPLLILFLIKIYQKIQLREYSDQKYALQLWGSLFLFVLTGLLFSLNCIVWDKYKINYKLVFELNPHDALDYKQFLVIPSTLLFIGTLLAYLSCDDLISKVLNFKYYTYIYFYITLAILLCPLNIFYLNARIWFIVSIFRLFLSGFYPIEFRDFFMGVITCSLTYSISNIYMLFCLQKIDWDNCLSCGPMKSYALGCIACIPPIWRAMQCLRRFLDTGEWFPHFANLAKYLITTSYFCMLSIYRISTYRDIITDSLTKSQKIITSIFIFISIINSIYSSFWDICMDWSLMQLSSDNYLLRDVLIYKHKKIYYVAIVFDIIMRFQWIVYVFTPYYISHHPLTAFFVAIVEILRRFIWMFFRMENEHASNVNLFRVSRACALPFSYSINSLINSNEISKFLKNSLNINIQSLFESLNLSSLPVLNIMELEDNIDSLSLNNLSINATINNSLNFNRLAVDLESMLENNNNINNYDSDIISINSAFTGRTTASVKGSNWVQLSRIISRAHTKEFQQRDNSKKKNININNDIGINIDDQLDLDEQLNKLNDDQSGFIDEDDDNNDE